MLYFANPCGPEVLAAMKLGQHLGYIDTPRQGNIRPAEVLWCADNGAFGKGFEEGRWLRFLERNANDLELCAFATAPDVVGDATETLKRSTPWFRPVRELGYQVALVGQDGLGDLDVPWDDFDAFFIGGSTEWKLGPEAKSLVDIARAKGKWVHMGRVNSYKRARYAASIGCDSVDGTYLTYGPKVNLPRLLSWMERINAPQLFDITTAS